MVDRILELLGWASLLALWVIFGFSYPDLSETIPLHFNAQGVPDRYGSKEEVILLPVLATLFFLGLTFMNKHFLKSKPSNEERVQKPKTTFYYVPTPIRSLQLGINLVFAAILIQIIRISEGEISGLGSLFLPMVIGIFTIPPLYFGIRQMFNSSKKTN